ncbi:MAG: MerR family transcriptional regulator [Aeromicrobium sp.]
MHSRNRGVFSISVVEELTGVSQQNLRAYEARGLVTPTRTRGGTRRYSQDDVDRINEIAALLETGVNHEGALRVMELRAEADSLRQQIKSMSDEGAGRSPSVED